VEVIGPASPEESLSADDILKKYPGAVEAICKACVETQYDAERIFLLNCARQQIMKIRGQQFGVPGLVGGEFGNYVDYLPFADGGEDGDQNGANVRLCPPINFIGGDCWKYTAVLGQRAPQVKAIADDPHDGESADAAHNADANIRDLWEKNEIDRLWRTVAFHQYATGPAFIRCFWNTDRKKYGSSTEPQLEVQEGQDGVPVPVEVGQKEYVNGDAEPRVYSILEVSAPWHSKTIDECGFLKCEVMRSKWELLKEYSDADGTAGKLEQYRTGDVPDDDMTGASTTAAAVRESSFTPSGTEYSKKQNQWRHSEIWAQPHLYQAITDPEARKIFEDHFPDGLYISKVGSLTMKIENQAATEVWTVCKVGHTERINDRPICADTVPLQTAINDLVGMTIETVLRAIPQTIMNSMLIDREAYSTKEAIPGEIILTATPIDGDINKQMAQIPPARLGDQVIPVIGLVRNWWQDINGIRPELTGGGEPTQTYREARQRRDQALLQLAPQADEMRYAAAETATLLVKLRAKYGSGTVKAQRKGAYGTEIDMVDMAALKDSGWHAEADDSWPMTAADTRDSLLQALEQFPPDVQQALSLLDPMNIESIFELIELPGFESAVREQVNKTLSVDVAQLLQSQPIPGAPGPDGLPGPKQPSIPPDSFDNHVIVANLLGKWLVSKTGQTARQSNPAGFDNVVAFQAAHQELAVPPPPPAPPPMRSGLNVTLKAEDVPNLIPEFLQSAGITGQPGPPQIPATPAAPGAPANFSAPAPMGGQQQAEPLPPLTALPKGQMPQPIQ
jgi:hypothetical protein